MSSGVEFQPWPKIPRESKNRAVVTEKIDGTNAQINIISIISNEVPVDFTDKYMLGSCYNTKDEPCIIVAGSRKRYITPEDDNYGFAQWVQDNIEELSKLGEGRHFGEWYGAGINRGYDLDHKRLALFNTFRWGPHNPNTPICCDVVPILYDGEVSALDTDVLLQKLYQQGSRLVPGFTKPEGIIVYYTATKTMIKATIENREGKWKEEEK